jgi:hypothetical protein
LDAVLFTRSFHRRLWTSTAFYGFAPCTVSFISLHSVADRYLKGDQPPKVVSSQAKRESVAFAISRGHSERGACELIGISRSMLNYQSVRAERDPPVIAAMKRLAQQYPRYGYRAFEPS